MNKPLNTLKRSEGFTLIEVVVSISIVAVLGLVLSTLLFTGISASSKGSAELYVGSELNRDLTRILEDYRNSTTHNISNIGVKNGNFILYTPDEESLLDGGTSGGESNTYVYDEKTKVLTRNGKTLMNNLESIELMVESTKPGVERLVVKLSFDYNGDKIVVPTFYATKRND